MFDIAFSEIFVIAVVALIVIGPERLPKVARTLGLLTGKVQRYVSTVKADIDRELHMEEVRRLGQETHNSILAVQSEIKTEVSKTETVVGNAVDSSSPEKPA